ncbi:TonB-dependent siderophore receptor [Steroidobacter flavus]|uniref:TonB-dependent siderophore receptor n=1 Tax=Steroidobacter flavus TaxID=1842136 RepID=A0ABV8SNZ4_9GAMM
MTTFVAGRGARWACGAAIALSLLTQPAGAQSKPPSAAISPEEMSFDVPAGPLAAALARFGEQAHLQFVYESKTVQGMRSEGIRGRMSIDGALTRLLQGLNVSYRYLSTGAVTIEPKQTNDTRVLGPVRVEGAEQSPHFGEAGRAAGLNGINGSRDITATEGTGSFTSGALTVGSKAPQALKDVPQSLSVLTSERMEQQNVTDYTGALRQLPGITLVQGATSIENTFYSRGFAITSIQVDGGAPLSTLMDFYPQIDMSIYDHVELLRGAAGLFNGYGDPSGTVNLVRKKPLDNAQFKMDAQAGSWNNYRVVADANSPLALEGKLRGRLILTYQDNDYFYDTAKDNKALIYGIAQLDATPTTLVTGGISYTRQDSVPWQGGLPFYQTGGDLGLPRSTCLCFPWNRWDFETTEIFGGVEQKLGDAWTLDIDLTRNRQQNSKKLGYSQGGVNPNNLRGPILTGTYNDYASDQLSTEVVLSGAFTAFGQRQEVTIGANRVKSDGAGRMGYMSLISGTAAAPYQPYAGGPSFYSGSPDGSQPPIDVFNFDPAGLLYSEPRNPLRNVFYPVYDTVQSSAYLNLRLTAFDRLHLTTGLRWSRYEFANVRETYCRNTTGACLGMQVGDVYSVAREGFRDEDVSWPPAASLSFDITKSLSAYLGYTDIYISQGRNLDVDHRPLPPVTGSNWEAGFKWSPRDGRLNVTLAAYRIRQKGFGMFSPDAPIVEVSPGVVCCYLVDPDRLELSDGGDLEATGELLPGWQLSASYTYDETKREGSYYGRDEGKPIVSIQPKHLYKLWTSYDFGAAGHGGVLAGLTLSAGINGQSSGYYSGSICVNLNPNTPPDPITGAQPCVSSAPPDRVDYSFTVASYAVVAARIDYRLSDKWSMALNIENLFDKTYYQTVSGSPIGGNWYGTPRSATVSVRGSW